MEKAFTQIKDADRKILENLDDKDLFKTLLTNKYLNSIADENFWRNRLMVKYPLTAEHKESDEWRLDLITQVPNTWKNYYLYVIYYVDKMQKEFDFKFVKGKPSWSYYLLSESKRGSIVGTGKIVSNLI